MLYIKKIGTSFEKDGVRATQEYIDDHWIEEEGHYRNLCYSKSRMFALQQILLEEQKDQQGYSYCCYCMRRLFLEDTRG